jgi:hypothetical protein
VRQSQIEGVGNPGASYFMEAGYIARDDISIYNTMGSTVRFNPRSAPTGNSPAFQAKPSLRGRVINQRAIPMLPAATAPIQNWQRLEAKGASQRKLPISETASGATTYAVMNHNFSCGDMQRV